MKKFSYIFIVLAIVLSIYNATKLDFNNLLQGDSLAATICIVAAMCAIMILLIFLTSKKIEEKVKNHTKK